MSTSEYVTLLFVMCVVGGVLHDKLSRIERLLNDVVHSVSSATSDIQKMAFDISLIENKTPSRSPEEPDDLE